MVERLVPNWSDAGPIPVEGSFHKDMHCYREGHNYTLDHLDGDSFEHLTFVNRTIGEPGTNNQEVIRALIDRVKYLEDEVHWEGNEKILYHLRMALVLHEARHLERLVELGKIEPEHIEVDQDGHYKIIKIKGSEGCKK